MTAAIVTSPHQTKLDALRGVSALVVLVGHAIQVFQVGPEWLAVLSGNLARHAVLVFFLLSGYLITQSIQSNVRRNRRFSVGEYLTARVTRIYPPLLGAIAVSLVAWAIIHGFDLPGASFYGPNAVRTAFTLTGADVLQALVMEEGLLEVNGPLWTLYIEVHLYLVAMLFALAWTQRSALWTGAALVLLAYYLQRKVEFALFAGVWGLGSVAALAPAHMRLVRWLGGLAALGIIVVALIDPNLLAIDHPNFGGPAQLAFALVYLWAAILSPGFWTPGWAVSSAHFSYTLYVTHFPLLLLGLSLAPSGQREVAAVVAALGCVLVAFWAARFLEDQRRFKPSIARAMS